MSVSPDSERLYGGWMEHKASDNKWNPVWCVLKRDGTLFFFTTQETSLNTHIGTLHVTKDSTFHYGPGDPKDGYRFDLHIQRKKKKFRVRKQYDREMWRGYLETVITGTVPQDVTLSPQDLHIISSKFQQTPSSFPSPPLRPSGPVKPGDTSDLEKSASSSSGSLWQANRERRLSQPSLGSTDTGSSGDGGFDPPTLVKFSIHDDSQCSSDSGVSDNGAAGGPFMNHVFDRKGNATPSWFFGDCNRILAEKILTECRSWGNTLMRVSGSALPTGSYVISKCLESSNKIVHYEVMRVAEGYKINAQNTTSTMTTLGEVMEFFIQLSGPATTRPIASNDLLKLGVHYDDYDRGPIGPHLDLPAQNVARCESPDQEVYDVPVQPPPPPPFPGPLLPSNTPAKASFKTWDNKKTEAVKWPIEPEAAAGSKTLGAADRRQVKAVSGKPSIIQVSQTLQEHDQTGAERKRPPLPAVPADRPKLCPSASSGYVNAASAPPDAGEDVDGVGGHPRWNKRSQSMPVLHDDPLSANVPPRVAAPSMLKPGGGATGGGGKIPPPTAPKTPGQRPRGTSIDDPTVAVPAKATSGLIWELQKKLQKRDQDGKEPADQPPTRSLAGKSPPPPPRCQEDVEEYYEAINPYVNAPT